MDSQNSNTHIPEDIFDNISPDELEELVDDISPDDTDSKNELVHSHDVEERSKSYSKIVQSYGNYIEKSLTSKMRFKHISFWVITIILVLIVLASLTAVIVMSCNKVSLLESLPVIIAATVSFLTAFLILPQEIVKYVFNENEEKEMREMMKLIMEYDNKNF